MVEFGAEERLVIAADFKVDEKGIPGIRRRVIELADSVSGTGVAIKVNSAARACGLELLDEISRRGVNPFLDWKLCDIPETMETDASIAYKFNPAVLTVMCAAGIDGMRRVRQALPMTEVLGVGVLTSLDEEECQSIFCASTKAAMLRFARMAQLAGLDGMILSGQEAEMLSKRKEITLAFNIPAIRPAWSLVPGDDQSRIVTIEQAIKQKARRVIIGRPIVNAKPNNEGRPQNPREAVEWCLKEIADALAAA